MKEQTSLFFISFYNFLHIQKKFFHYKVSYQYSSEMTFKFLQSVWNWKCSMKTWSFENQFRHLFSYSYFDFQNISFYLLNLSKCPEIFQSLQSSLCSVCLLSVSNIKYLKFLKNEKDFQLICPVHLPGQNIFCRGQNQICPRQNNFVNDKVFFVHYKNFVHRLKIIFALRKLVWNHGQNFCPGQKIFCHRQN